MSTPERGRAEARLQWFLDASATLTNSGHRRRQPNAIVVGAGAAVFGTILVLVAQEMGNPWRDALAMLAWVLFVMAAGSGVRYAYQHRSQPREPLTPSSIRRARELAEQMNAASATMPTGPRLRA